MQSFLTITATKPASKCLHLKLCMVESAETPLYWNETGESQVFGPEVLRRAEEQVQAIRENLRTAQS